MRKKPPRAGAGRKPGSKNKFPTALKDKVLHACEQLEKEGKDLATTAAKNPEWFYQNFVKPMLPKEVWVKGDGENPLRVVIVPKTKKDA